MHTAKGLRPWLKWSLTALAVVAVVLVIGNKVSVQAQGPEDMKPMTDFPEQMAAWAASAHGNTYDLGKGPNTYCSRCHSPQNWDPASTTSAPPNCVTCKFPTDPELRIAPTMDFVEEADWVGITCATCHQVDGDMIDTTTNMWLNPIADEYVSMNSTNQLCGQCHTNSTGVSETGGRGVDHEIILGGSAHRNWAATIGDRRPDQCSDCHDPHTQQPQACVDCHEEVLTMDTHIMGENEQHLENVNCIACHDASGSQVGPLEEGAMWTTIETSVSRSGETVTAAIVSHSVQWEVSCDRCHFADNAFELPVLTADGEEVE